MIDEGRERRTDYNEVLAQINVYLLQTDPNYCYIVIKELLDKKRVEGYLYRGLQKDAEQPCGMYKVD